MGCLVNKICPKKEEIKQIDFKSVNIITKRKKQKKFDKINDNIDKQ